jgi:sarcosine oxidase
VVDNTNPSGTVAVVGTGTMGAMALWQLSRMGVNPVGFDLHSPGHAFGSAGGETRTFRSAYAEGAMYGPLLAESITQWRQLEADTGTPLLTMTGGLMIGKMGSDYLRSVLATVTANGLPFETLSASDIREKYPQIPVDDDEVGIFDFGTGVLRAEFSVELAACEAERLGATMHRNTEVTSIVPGPDGVVIETASGVRQVFDHVIVAAGAWTNDLIPNTIPRLDVQRIAVHWYPLQTPELFAYGTYPFVSRDDETTIFCSWPSTDGTTVKVGLNSGIDHIAHARDLVQEMPDEVIPIVDAYVAKYVPDAGPIAVRHAVQMDAWTADHHFIIGAAPTSDRVTVLAGFSAHGFKMSPAIGLVAAQLATMGQSSINIDGFSPTRFAMNPTLL